MNKIFCTSQNKEAKTLPADVWVFGRFGWFSSATVHSADCRFNWSGGSMFLPLLQTSFSLRWNSWKKKNALNRRRVVVGDQLWANAPPTLNTAFSLTNVHAKWWIHYHLISSTPLLSHATSIYDQPKRVCGVFGVFRDNCRIWTIWAFSIIYVCTIVFNVSIPLLNRYFWWSRDWITPSKPLLCLNNIFPIRKQCFINIRNSDFSIVLKICNSSFT